MHHSTDQGTPPANRGLVVAVRGSVVDLRFDEHLPSIYRLLRAGSEGQIRIEVLAQLDAQHVRGIALTPTQGLARGMSVEDSGGPLMAPVGKGILGRMFDVFGNAIDRQPHPPRSNGAPCITPRQPWRGVPPSPRSSRPGSSSSMC
jgi:F-type H+-transporting ATPase subunit beta